jgi:hypothetical protein
VTVPLFKVNIAPFKLIGFALSAKLFTSATTPLLPLALVKVPVNVFAALKSPRLQPLFPLLLPPYLIVPLPEATPLNAADQY